MNILPLRYSFSVRLLAALFVLGAFLALPARAIMPQPYTVGLSFSARIYNVGNCIMDVAGEPGATSSGMTSTMLETDLKTAWLKPGKIYKVNMSWSGLSGWSMSFTAPEGYSTYINGVQTDLVNVSGGGGPGTNYQYDLELRPIYDQSLAPFGNFSGIQLGKSVSWSIGLGALRTGRSAGRISYREQDISSAPAARAKLYYGLQPNNDQLLYINDPSSQVVRQILTAQAVADITDDGSGGTWIKCYNWHVPTPPSYNGTLGVWVFSDSPWKTIHVETPGTNELKISESEDGRTRVSWLKLTTGSVGSGNYTWVLKEGNSSTWSASDWARTTIQTSSVSGSDRTVVEEIRNGTDSSTAIAKNRYLYKTYAWGEELSQQEVGYSLSNSVTTTYGYYTDIASRGNYRQLKWSKDTTGAWTGYQRYDDWDRRGQVQYRFRPWKDQPAAPTSESNTFSGSDGVVDSLDYGVDWTGRYTRVTSREQKIYGVTTGKSTYLQQDATSSGPYRELTTSSDYFNSSNYLTTYSETVRADADPDLAGSPLVVESPDGERTVYSMTRGVFDHGARTFAVSSSGADWRILIAHGSKSSSGATQVSGYDSQSLYSTYMVPNKSTLEVKVLNNSGHLFRSETHVYTTGTAFDTTPVAYEDSDYTPDSGRFRSSLASNGAARTVHFSGGLPLDDTGPDGVETDFTYDNLWRLKTTKKVGASTSGSYAAQVDLTTTTNYGDNGSNQVITQVVSNAGDSETITTSTVYDLAGRVTSQTPPGLSATTVAYNPSAGTTTVTAPDGGTTVATTYPDGQAVSTTGTATVASYSSYGVETDGRRYLQTNLGTSTSPRWSKRWVDWLGRTTESRSPGFSVSSQSDFITQNTYDPTTGLLTKTKRVNASNARLYADTLYSYNTLGQLTRSGLDVDNDGSLVLASMDRITDVDASFEYYSSSFWTKQTTTTYPLASANTPFVTSITRNRLTGFTGTLRAEARATDAEGNVAVSTTTASGKTITATTTAPGIANNATSVVYNGLAVGATGFDGLTNLAQFDNLGRPWKSTDPRSLVTTTAYYANTGLTETVIDSAGHAVATYSYDTSGRVTSQADALGAVTRTAYDTRSLVTNTWGTGGYPVSYAFDSTYGDRTGMSTYRGGSGWDGTSWPTSTAGTADTTTWTTDAASALLWKKTDAAGKVVEFDYDARRQSASRKWARKLTATGYTTIPVTTTYGYDSATGELLTTTYNDSVEPIPTPGVTYTYNRAGQVSTIADGAGTRTFAYQSAAPWRLDYEALPSFFDSRRVTRLYESTTGTTGSFGSYTTGTVRGRGIGFDLGISGNQARDLHQQYTASNLGRFVGVTGQAGGGTAQDFVYAYKSGARLLDGYAAGSFGVSRDYESTRDLTSRIEAKWSTTSLTRFDFTYNDRYERLTAKQSGTAYADYYNGTYSSVFNNYNYNLRGELQTSAMYRGDTVSTTPSSADEIPGRRFEYRFDNIGNRVTAGATGSAGTADDEYVSNALNQYTAKENNTVRLFGTVANSTNVAVPGLTVGRKDRTWAADLVPGTTPAQGSTTIYSALSSSPTGTIGVKSVGWFIPPAAQTVSYDDDGNLSADGVFTYTWNAENQLVRASSLLPTGSGFTRQKLDFKYDYASRRIEKRVTNLNTSTETLARRFLYDGWNLVAEIDANTPATILRSYAWGLDITGDFTKSGGVGALLRMTNYSSGSPGTSYYPAYDGNGNVASLINASSGSVAAAYEYDPFGNYIRNEAIDSAVADAPFRFSTKYTDSETGWAYYGLRYYSSTLGRFINKDPIAEQGGLNLYAFCGNNGINRWDYLGMDANADIRNIEALDVPDSVRTFVSYMRRTFGQWRFPGVQYNANLENVWVTAFSDVTGERVGYASDRANMAAQDARNKAAYEQEQQDKKNDAAKFQGTPGRSGEDSKDVDVTLPTYKVSASLDPKTVEMINDGQLSGIRASERVSGEAAQMQRSDGVYIPIGGARELDTSERSTLDRTLNGLSTLSGDPMLAKIAVSLKGRDYQVMTSAKDIAADWGMTFPTVPGEGNIIYLNPALFKNLDLMMADANNRRTINWTLLQIMVHEDVHLRLGAQSLTAIKDIKPFVQWQHDWIPDFTDRVFKAILNYSSPSPNPAGGDHP